MSSLDDAGWNTGQAHRPILVCADDAKMADAVVHALAFPFAVAVPLAALAVELERGEPPGVQVVIVVTEFPSTVAAVRRSVVRYAPKARVLAVSYYADDASLVRYLAAGADGIVPSAARLQDLLLAINNLIADRAHLPLDAAPLVRDLIAGRDGHQDTSALHGADHLSARERDVLQYVAERHTNKEIASRLRLEEQTVKNHVTSILRKLGLHSRFDAARAAPDLLAHHPGVRKAGGES